MSHAQQAAAIRRLVCRQLLHQSVEELTSRQKDLLEEFGELRPASISDWDRLGTKVEHDEIVDLVSLHEPNLPEGIKDPRQIRNALWHVEVQPPRPYNPNPHVTRG